MTVSTATPMASRCHRVIAWVALADFAFEEEGQGALAHGIFLDMNDVPALGAEGVEFVECGPARSQIESIQIGHAEFVFAHAVTRGHRADFPAVDIAWGAGRVSNERGQLIGWPAMRHAGTVRARRFKEVKSLRVKRFMNPRTRIPIPIPT